MEFRKHFFGFGYIINTFFLCFFPMFRMFSKSARSRSNVCCWAVCAKAGSSSSTSRHRGAPAGKAWTSWISPPLRQTSVISTCEPPEGALFWIYKRSKKKHIEKKFFVKAEKKEQKKKMLKTQALWKTKEQCLLVFCFVLFFVDFLYFETKIPAHNKLFLWPFSLKSNRFDTMKFCGALDI